MNSGDLRPSSVKRSTSKVKIALRLLTLAALILFVALQIIVRHRASRPVVIRLKSEAERAKLPANADSYPCLLIERPQSGSSQHLEAAIRQCLPSPHNDADIEQYEVDLRSGRFVLRQTDLFVSDTMPLALTRAYRLWDNQSRAFGVGGNHSYDIFPIGDHFPYTYMDLVLGDGAPVHYNRISEGSSYLDFVAEHKGAPPTVFEKSQVRWNVDHWDLTFQDGTLYRFPDSYRAKRGVDGALIGMSSPQHDEIKFVRDGHHNLQSLTAPHGHQIQFTYGQDDRISAASDDAGHAVNYLYDHAGRLSEVRENGSMRWRYVYNSSGMTAVQDSTQHDILVIEYSSGRVSRIIQQWTSQYRFDYILAPGGNLLDTIVTGPLGKKTVFKF